MRRAFVPWVLSSVLVATACSASKTPPADTASAAEPAAAPVAAPAADSAADSNTVAADSATKAAATATKKIAPPDPAPRDSFRKPKFEIDEKTGKVTPIKKP